MKALVHSCLFVAAVTASLTASTYALLELDLNLRIVALAASATMLVYLLDRLAEASPEDSLNVPERRHWIDSHRPLLLTEFVGASLCSVVLLFYLRPQTLALGATLALLALAYVVPLGPQRWRIKELPATKAVWIALVWASASVLIPAVEAGTELSGPVWTLAGHHFLMVFAAAVICDLRDIQGDRSCGINTLPVLVGSRTSQIVCVGCLATAAGWISVGVIVGELDSRLLALLLPDLALMALSARNDAIADTLYYGILVDGALGLPGLIALACGWIP